MKLVNKTGKYIQPQHLSKCSKYKHLPVISFQISILEKMVIYNLSEVKLLIF